MIQRDQIYSEDYDLVEGFRFDKGVASVFSDMIRRSVPGYGMVLSLVGVLAERYLQSGGRGYDLGASLGASTLAMAAAAAERGAALVAVDNSPSMVERCRENLKTAQGVEIDLRCEDIRQTVIHSASFVTMNFTLQFLPIEEREQQLRSVAEGLQPGGALMLSEKIRFEDPEQQQRMESLHHAFKRANGYSELEISQKRSALEAVLITETLEQHFERLHGVGFKQVEVIFQTLNFVSILAVR
ncbi:MAG: carboxy-S-adenosyl-L-methionine synthase CmoA [Gammaproteobacteria bacterium]|jgi:tRNA (cmo5U34)-methyltransferase|nr:carboxy-S-adenosyl-L-methionine synthase CmoA [Gammaproteobacteria bacterium]MBT4607190.1 carboxy-S-adenosyl-L-methionine synthase CmoA [Thiotrichales bacterium]MBT3472619.1 carboxy-S-adenosyl-L-methionine synthase CmoA [Gammaproteobacteria bacterium]MBT3968319.1 carboxy-S-adenosyl-L-methionine synthase CmoA [Gammaproteobacteria bacterium]MBT4080699.1 carboxy-S-adenosyl-L-methionine synthase CmoA [Gammaproteobacteria bacterium]